MQHDKDHHKRPARPDLNKDINKADYGQADDYDRVVLTEPPRNNGFGVPLLIAAFVLVAALVAIIMTAPRGSENDSMMPTAYNTDTDFQTIEPAANGNVDTIYRSRMSSRPAYATEQDCVEASDGTSCTLISCTLSNAARCPAGLAEAWQPAASPPESNGTLRGF